MTDDARAEATEKEVLLKLLSHLRKKSKREKDTAAAKQGELMAMVRVLSGELQATDDAQYVGVAPAPTPTTPSRAAPRALRPDVPAASVHSSPRAAAVVNSPREMRADDLIPHALAAADNKLKNRPQKRVVYVKHSRDKYARAVEVDEAERLRREIEARVAELGEMRAQLEAVDSARRGMVAQLDGARAAAERHRADEAEAKRQLLLLSRTHAAELESQRRELTAELVAKHSAEIAHARELAERELTSARAAARAIVPDVAGLSTVDEACGPDAAEADTPPSADAALEQLQTELQLRFDSQLGRMELRATNAEARIQSVHSEYAVRERRTLAELDQTREDLARAERAIETREAQINELRSKLDVSLVEVDRFAEANGALAMQLETREAQIKELRSKLDGSLVEVDRFAEANGALAMQLEVAEARCTQLSAAARPRSVGGGGRAEPAKVSVGTCVNMTAPEPELKPEAVRHLLSAQSSAHAIELGLLAAELSRRDTEAAGSVPRAPTVVMPAAAAPATASHEVGTSSGDLLLILEDVRRPASIGRAQPVPTKPSPQVAWAPPPRVPGRQQEPPLERATSLAERDRQPGMERFVRRAASSEHEGSSSSPAARQVAGRGPTRPQQARSARAADEQYEPVSVGSDDCSPGSGTRGAREGRVRALAYRHSHPLRFATHRHLSSLCSRLTPRSPLRPREQVHAAPAASTSAPAAAPYGPSRRTSRGGGLLSSITSFFSRRGTADRSHG